MKKTGEPVYRAFEIEGEGAVGSIGLEERFLGVGLPGCRGGTRGMALGEPASTESGPRGGPDARDEPASDESCPHGGPDARDGKLKGQLKTEG